jgi:hypothetical protein
MDDFLDQIEAAGQAGLWHVALYCALGLPDICASLAAPNGETSRARYIEWFKEHVGPSVSGGLSAEDAYFFRCSMLHQGTTEHPNSSYRRVFFVEPGARITMHGNRFDDVLNIDLRVFCLGLAASVRRWLGKVSGTEPFESNRTRLMRRHPDGFAPYVVGMPVIA